MKVILLVTGGRGGSDFFQGLLDNHSEILQFPGILNPDKKFSEIFKTVDLKNIPEKFINYVPIFFDSRKNKIERHDRLGRDRNRHYIVDKKKFKFFFLRLAKSSDSKFDLLKKLHQAYYLSRNKKINSVKILFIHTHTVEYTKKFIKLMNIKKYSILHTMRHPLEALNSPIRNWLNYKEGKFFFPKELYFQYDLALNGLSDLVSINKKTYVVLLENLLTNKKIVMKDFCKIFKISFSKKLLNCTYFGMQWWGDEVSGRWISKSPKNKKNNKEKYFYDRDVDFFYTLTEAVIGKYFRKYKKNHLNKKIFFNCFPMKSEILVWQNTIKHKKIKDAISIPYFYFKRLFLLNKIFVKNKVLPYSIGSNS